MYHIIVNPIAGKGRTLDKLPLLTRLFDAHNLTHEVIVTQHIMDAYDKAKDICISGSDGIVGIGGDGTIQEIVAGMAAAYAGPVATPLGIFPGGSGNDFVMTLAGGKAQALARYKKKNAEASAAEFFGAIKTYSQEGTITTVDLIDVNGMAYLNIGNIGLDARVVRNAITYKQRFGRYAYVAAVYKSIAQHANMPLFIDVDGKVYEGNYTLVAVCNGQYYGGGLHLAPQAQLNSGKIMLCLVEALSRPKTMVIFPSLMVGKHHKLKAVSFHECEKVSITLKSGTECLSLDGNLHEIKSTSGQVTSQAEGIGDYALENDDKNESIFSSYNLHSANKGVLHFKILPKWLKIFQ